MFLNISGNTALSEPTFLWEYVVIKDTNTVLAANKKYPISTIVNQPLVFDNLHRSNIDGGSCSIYAAKYENGEWQKDELVVDSNDTFSLRYSTPLILSDFISDPNKNYFILPFESVSFGPSVTYFYKDDNDLFQRLETLHVDKIGDTIPKHTKPLPTSSQYNYYDNLIYKGYYRSNTSATWNTSKIINPGTDKVDSFTTDLYISRQGINLYTIRMEQDSNNTPLCHINDNATPSILHVLLAELQGDAGIGLSTQDDPEPIWCAWKESGTFTVTSNAQWTVNGDKPFDFIFKCNSDTNCIPDHITLRLSNEPNPFATIPLSRWDNDWYRAAYDRGLKDSWKTVILALYVTLE